MCVTCGCSDEASPMVTNLQTGQVTSLQDGRVSVHHHDHDHGHVHDHDHGHDHDRAHVRHRPHTHARTVTLEEQVLAKNDRCAEHNRGWFAGRNVLALNLVSSPGAGKTTLLERTIQDVGSELKMHVIEGDQATLQDAERIQAAGGSVVQINTGKGCHLEAEMVGRGLQQLNPPMNSVLLIENVGNMVCPALFDLGEHAKVVIASVPEGDDKPLKYPHMFRAGSLLLLNKTDLLPHVKFDIDRFTDDALQVNPQIEILHISATTGEGLEDWYAWLAQMSQTLNVSIPTA